MSCNHCHCEAEHHEEESRIFPIVKLAVGTVLFILAAVFKSRLLYILSYIVLGYDVIFGAFREIRNIFNENLLMTVATLGALFIGEYPEAAAVMLFFQVGEFLSDLAVDKSRESIGSLMELRADNVLRNGEFVPIPSECTEIGEIVRVVSGEKIPLDGTVTEGSAYLDTKGLTGESVPRFVTAGDSVLSGSICSDSVLLISVTKKYEDSTASKIMRMVNDDKKSNSEKFITKFARVYTPIVVLIALLIILLPFAGELNARIYRAMLFLVVSCPCALVVSVPLSFFAGIGCAKNGILVKGAFALEHTAKIKKMAFDKTGTLTEGKFSVISANPENISEEELVMYAAHCEIYSSHPIADAIKEYYGKAPDEKSVTDFKNIIGKGVSATVNGHEIRVGTAEFAGSMATDRNTVYVSVDGRYQGSLTVSDNIKETSLKALKNLKSLGIESVILTGDSSENTEAVAQSLAIPAISSLLPEDKVQEIQKIQKTAKTGFVGDGINDAPVLSNADVGISMGGIGSDAAIEASDIVLTSDDLTKIPKVIKISRKTMRIVYENIIMAISVKAAVMLLGLFGIATMWLAVFADVGVCILAVLNASRAFFSKD